MHNFFSFGKCCFKAPFADIRIRVLIFDLKWKTDEDMHVLYNLNQNNSRKYQRFLKLF